MDKLNEEAGYKKFRSVSHFVEESIMKYYESQLVPLEHYNLSEKGIRILDKSLKTATSKGRIIDVYFKPDRVGCDYCKSDNCRHVKFALSLPEVQEIIRKKGWKIPQFQRDDLK